MNEYTIEIAERIGVNVTYVPSRGLDKDGNIKNGTTLDMFQKDVSSELYLKLSLSLFVGAVISRIRNR